MLKIVGQGSLGVGGVFPQEIHRKIFDPDGGRVPEK
jgi:hypothetical protein